MGGIILRATEALRRIPGTLAKYGNPVYHWHRMQEDLLHFSNAIKNRKDFGRDIMDRQGLAEAFRGKLFGSFFFSGPFSFTGVLFGAALQYLFKNPWLGIFAPVAIGHLVSTIAYQVIWWLDNRKLYATYTSSGWRQFIEMEKDLIPIHIAGFKVALAFAAITIPFNSVILVILDHFSHYLATVLPMSVMVMFVDLLFVSSTIVRVMGDLFERHAFVLADKYRMALNQAA